MNIRSLTYFVILADELNFSRAAQRLFITQQALSSHIQRLETEFGVHFFERRPYLRLTLEGEQLLLYAKHILDAQKKMRTCFSDISTNCRGRLKIGISRLRSNMLFPRLWNIYHKLHSNIAIELIDGNSEKLGNLLQAGEIDFYIGVDVPSKINHGNIELSREKIHCCIAKSLLMEFFPDDYESLINLFYCQGADLMKILTLPFIALSSNNRLRKAIDTFFATQLDKPTYIFECDQQELIFTLARTGSGVGLLSPTICYQKISALQKSFGRDFYIFPVINEIPENTIHLVYRTDYPRPRFVNDMIDIISTEIKEAITHSSQFFQQLHV